MKNMLKTLLAAFSSLVISFSAFAGELSVSGSAEATYIIGGTDDSNSKGLGVSNELNFTASGEFGNGYTWSYSMELDGASTANDDTQLVLGLDNLGTVAVCITECGLSQELSYGIGAYGVGSDIVNTGGIKWGQDVSTYNNVQYHLPSGLLPFGITAKVGYAPNLTAGQGSSAKEGNDIENTTNESGISTATKVGKDASMYAITAAPIDGLTIGADYFRADGGTQTDQQFESGDAFAKYAMGPFVIGYAKTLVAPGLDDASSTSIQTYETDAYGIQFAVNENFSVSYNNEKSESTTQGAITAGDTKRTKTKREVTVDTYQVAYNIGGATLALVKSEADNAGYTLNKEVSATVISLKMAF
jgi:hypothetical protein